MQLLPTVLDQFANFNQLRVQMDNNKYRTLNPLIPAQTGRSVYTTGKPGLRPHPPPKERNQNILRQNRLNCFESVTPPPMFGPYETEHFPPPSKYGIKVDQWKAEVFRQQRYECYLPFMNVAQAINQEKSLVSERQRKAKNQAGLKTCSKESEVCKTEEPKEVLEEQEDLRSSKFSLSQQRAKKKTFPQEIKESERDAVRNELSKRLQFSELAAWVQNMFSLVMERRHSEIKDPVRQLEVIRDFFQLERTEYEMNAPKATSFLYCSSKHTSQESERAPERELKVWERKEEIDRIRSDQVRELQEKLQEFYKESLGSLCNPYNPLRMVKDLKDWILEIVEVTPLLRRRRLRKELFEAYFLTLRENKEVELEILRAEQREGRRERAFATPPPKIIFKKPMPRSLPPTKERPAKTNQLQVKTQ